MSDGLGLERARVFEVADREFALPDLTTVARVAIVTEPVETDIATTYFDTVDLRLAARQITVCRTSAGDDVAWDLRIPGEDGADTRVRKHAEQPCPTVPDELTELVRGSVRDKELEPVANVRTVRNERRLLDAEGRELALVRDDVVHGQRFVIGGAELTRWREVAVELLDGGPDLLDAATAALRDAGLAVTSSSRLQRALGRAGVPAIDLRERPGDETVARVVAERLREEVAVFFDRDWGVRSDRPGAVHDMRAAIRRLRSDLATWRPFLDESRTEEVRRELRWLGGLLGRLRDAEMLEARLLGTVRGLPADMLVGPVRERIERELRDRRTTGADRVAAAFEGARYFGLLDALETLAAEPPLTTRAEAPIDDALTRRVAHAISRFDGALAALDSPAAPEVRADRLHEVRKAARRAGYAAESMEPQFGRRARRLADLLSDLQDALGEHHDSIVARQTLRDIGASAHVAGESAFTYGVLHGIERDRGEAAERAFEAACQAMGPWKARRWTSA